MEVFLKISVNLFYVLAPIYINTMHVFRAFPLTPLKQVIGPSYVYCTVH